VIARSNAPADQARVRVWDPLLRLLHWTVALSMLAAAVTTTWWVEAHQPIGWVAAVAVALRVAWGFIGSPHARLGQFMRSPRATWAYAQLWWQGREPRHVGHNPLGGWMALALWAWVLGLALSGWLYTTDRWFGDERVEWLHDALAWSLPVLVALHLGGVRRAGKRHQESLVRAMLDGRKRPAQGTDRP